MNGIMTGKCLPILRGGGGFHFSNYEVDVKWFENYINNRAHNVRLAILEDEMIIGCVYLLNIDFINQSGELGILIGEEKNRNRGIGKFAIDAMVKHAFDDLNLQRIQLEVLRTNSRAISCYKKCGFEEEGIKHHSVYKNGEWNDVILMAKIKQ